jgi:26S proteasome regulatory subunit N10
VINFANPDNVPKLQALVDAANKNDNSHFLDVPMGVSMITDVLFTSPILQGDDFGGAGAPGAGAADGTNGMVNDVLGGGPGAAGGGLGQFGVDFENDPELAQALRISMDEERARQTEEEKKDGAAPADTAQPPGAQNNAAAADEGEDSHDEEYYI